MRQSAAIEVLDTTLRDGTQGEGFVLSTEDKVAIARRLAAFGVPLIEGGWPGSNPKDAAFFQRMKGVDLGAARLVAFGATHRKGLRPEADPSVQALLEARTPVVTLFGKSWTLHVREALGVNLEEHLWMIEATVAHLVRQGRRVIYDAEHFFDGFKEDPAYAMETLRVALRGGADTLVLCDTNGGSLPEEVYEITRRVVDTFPRVRIGIHAHNDAELAVANTLAAVRAGARHVQGTIGGYGERCGNANLVSLIPTLMLKYGYAVVPRPRLAELKVLARFVDERANLTPNRRAPYVGEAAFAHKGGVHVSAVLKNPRTYEHIDPQLVGNARRILVSDLAGRSNLLAKLAERGLELEAETARSLLEEVKALEHAGYAFEGAEASFYLLAHRLRGGRLPFVVRAFRAWVQGEARGAWQAEATVQVQVGAEVYHTAAMGEGPVGALDNALRKALLAFYPELEGVELADYKVRVLSGQERGTASGVRVLVEMTDGKDRWGTVGASVNILEASLKALADGYAYVLVKEARAPHQAHKAS
ncbi:citramalate synthase [Marinithermus hydrothermalis]|uniref:Citramalate synthase n=1 Tax=Marinithermus hydrothermalis (strain DSM 14884 / JCM 11576 / T1) TaxID=869210 RepID=F2NL85_MARHT|nr:citramalate synthase [Marinithermus hydrothermalis]AEB11704.1 2-isopropylmalate synthase/homocitrate synthase family protein [Marinithermus hydrothermalis DSM 14884]